jgi:uncharacterized protein YdhG (YjbR/CyaY superfamily)
METLGTLAKPPERMNMAGPDSFDDYLSQVSDEARTALEWLRKTIKAAAPDTTETISYQMPTFKYRGRALVGFAAFKDHCSLFPYSKKVMEVLEEDLRPYDISGKGATIRFTTDRPLPAALVKKVVKARIEEIESRSRP